MLFLNVSFMLGKKNNIKIINDILENLKIISQFYFSNFNLNILTYIYIYTCVHICFEKSNTNRGKNFRVSNINNVNRVHRNE